MWHLKQHNCTSQLPYSNKALKKKRKTFMTDQNMNEVSFEIELLDKHKEYGTQYQSNDFLLGVGIENECYLGLTCSARWIKFLLTNGIREKYSINHFSNYKENVFENSLQKIN
jgi:hypothetical protein